MKEEKNIDTSRVNRVEVINHTSKGAGRDYVFWPRDIEIQVEVALQDDGRTLKIFIK